jgi:hypothetical protein
MLYPFSVSIEQYIASVGSLDKAWQCRPEKCPQCLNGRMDSHGFYSRTVTAPQWSGEIRVRRYWCSMCRRTVSLLPDFVLPYWRFTIVVMRLFLIARLVGQQTLAGAAAAAHSPTMPYQRGQQWIRRFRGQAQAIAAALSALVQPAEAEDFTAQAIGMLEKAGWLAAHRFVFEQLRMHLMGWPEFLVPDGKPPQSG